MHWNVTDLILCRTMERSQDRTSISLSYAFDPEISGRRCRAYLEAGSLTDEDRDEILAKLK